MSRFPECGWRVDDDDVWDTDCDNKFQLTDGTPPENKMRYCCYCGRRLKVRRKKTR